MSEQRKIKIDDMGPDFSMNITGKTYSEIIDMVDAAVIMYNIRVHGTQTKAADMLEVNRATLRKKLQKVLDNNKGNIIYPEMTVLDTTGGICA